MEPRYFRPLSPGSRRIAAQPGRSSTGTLIYPPSSDREYHTSFRDREGSSGAGVDPRSSAERIIVPRPTTSTRVYRDQGSGGGGGGRSKDDYVVSPRRATLEPLSVPSRRPLSIVTTASSPNRHRPVVSSAIEPSSSSRRMEGDDRRHPHYLIPASSSSRHDHRRIYSADTSDAPQYRAGSRGGRSAYNFAVPVVRPPRDQDDPDDGYEYTDRKAQMYRDTAPRPRVRRGSDVGRRERPLSAAGVDEYLPRGGPALREAGPPVSQRGFVKIDRKGSIRREYRIPREPEPTMEPGLLRRRRDDSPESSHQRRASRAPPVALHQSQDRDHHASLRDDRKDGPGKQQQQHHHHGSHRTNSLDRQRDVYGSNVRHASDDYRGTGSGRLAERRDSEGVDDRDRHHRSYHRLDRGDVDERDHRADTPRKDKHGHRVGEEMMVGGAALAATALAAESIKDRHHHRGDRPQGDLEADPAVRHRNRHHDPDRPDPSESSSKSGDNSDEERRERRRRRRRERERERDGREEPSRTADGGRGRDEESGMPRDDLRRATGSYERKAQYPPDERSSSDGESRERKQLQIVEPVREKEREAEAKQPPRGILRPPREKFPEDPTPVREGVAPLKDAAGGAGKKGVPANARWTKIDRKLVNPEALEKGNERFEERTEYVIVLRVLAREEIEGYAVLTREIREKRFHDERQHRQRVTALEAAERQYERGPAAAIADRSYDEATRSSAATAAMTGGGREREREQQQQQQQPPPPSVPPKTPSPMPPSTHQPQVQQQPPVSLQQGPSTSLGLGSESTLREDPLRPGTYLGYQRVPPALGGMGKGAQQGAYEAYPPPPPPLLPPQQQQQAAGYSSYGPPLPPKEVDRDVQGEGVGLGLGLGS